MTPETKWRIAVAALIAIASLRVASTYYRLSATTDEPAHIACGMEWLEGKMGLYEYQHPPLARAMIGLPLYLSGVRSAGLREIWPEGWSILYADEHSRDRLALARLGTLPFLVLGAVVVGLWAKRWFGPWAGLWAVFLFLCLPPILAHSGQATLDMGATATCALALYQLLRWREEPTMRRALILAAAFTLALLCKFSVPAFFVIGAVLGWLGIRHGEAPKLSAGLLLKQAAAALGLMLVLVWAGYRFHVQPMFSADDRDLVKVGMERVFGNHSAVARVVDPLFGVSTPFGGLFRGFAEVANHDAKGQPSFLLGTVRDTGIWYFFPVVLAVKTPIGFAVLALIGLGAALWRFRGAKWQHRVTALFALGILLVCMTSRINRGVRHVLPIYAPLAVLAGGAAANLTTKRKWFWVPLALSAWLVAVSVWAHPDYLPYFNELALGHPEKILVDSDLDWGQDLGRLSARLREKHVDHIGIQYWGGELIEHAGLPPFTKIKPREETAGYVAISIHDLYTGHAADGSWDWLYRLEPVERIGHSINLYYVRE